MDVNSVNLWLPNRKKYFFTVARNVEVNERAYYLTMALFFICHGFVKSKFLIGSFYEILCQKMPHFNFLCEICFRKNSEKILNCYENYLNLLSRYRRYIRRVSGSRSIIFSTTKAIFRVLALIQPAECEKTSRHPCRYLFFFNFIYSLV